MKKFCGNNCYIIGPTGPTGATERLFNSSNRIVVINSS